MNAGSYIDPNHEEATNQQEPLKRFSPSLHRRHPITCSTVSYEVTTISHLLLWRRIVLQHLGGGLVEILLPLVWLCLWINRLTCDTTPHQVMTVAVVHIEGQLSRVDR